jgi:hypothetical protein
MDSGRFPFFPIFGISILLEPIHLYCSLHTKSFKFSNCFRVVPSSVLLSGPGVKAPLFCEILLYAIIQTLISFKYPEKSYTILFLSLKILNHNFINLFKSYLN